MTPEQLTNEELATKLAVVLQEWPLYRQLHYKGADRQPYAPQELRLFCSHARCGFETTWQIASNQRTVVTSARGFPMSQVPDEFFQAKYQCRNCSNRIARYYYFWLRKGDEGWLSKVGQYPELEERVTKSLEEKLDAEDLKAYKNALRMRNFNYGIAAVAYMRRVVENRMNDMLDVLYETARTHGSSKEVMARHEEMMLEKRFSRKVDYAGDLLPRTLRPEGQPNPMAILHELASDGLHAKSDAACVEIFDACKHTFEYVFGKMRIENDEAKKFVASIAGLVADSPKKARPKVVAAVEDDGAEPETSSGQT